MEFMISGRNLTVSDRFREYAGEKISKIESLGDKVQRVDAKVFGPLPLAVRLVPIGVIFGRDERAAVNEQFDQFIVVLPDLRHGPRAGFAGLGIGGQYHVTRLDFADRLA